MPRPRAPLVAAAVVVAAVGALLGGPPLRDTDWGWHVAQGDRVLAEGRLPWDDVWMATTEGVRAAPYAWAFDVLLALAERLGGGPAGVAAWSAAWSAALGLALLAVVVRRGVAPLVAAGVVVAALLAVRVRLLPRPHVVGDVLLVVTLGLLLEARAGRPRLAWAVPALAVPWANLHPSAAIGALLAGVFAAGEAARAWLAPAPRPGELPCPTRADLARLLAVVVAAGAATLATPLGLAGLEYLGKHDAWVAGVVVTELRPLSWEFAMDRQALLAVALLALPALLRRQPLRDPGPWLVALACGVVAARASRFFVELVLTTAIAAAPAFAPTARPPRGGPRLPRAAAAALALLLARLLAAARGELTLDRPLLHPALHCPATADFLAATPVPEPVFNSQRLGGYLVYRLRGRPRLFWDGRLPFYGALLGEGRFDALQARFGFRTVVLAEREAITPLEAPPTEDAWRLVHLSDEARVYVSATDPAAADLRDRHGVRHARFRWQPFGLDDVELVLVPDPADPRAAVAELEALAARDPAGRHLRVALAQAYLALGDRARARAAAEAAHAARPSSATRALLSACRD